MSSATATTARKIRTDMEYPPIDWGKVREQLDRASRAPEWPDHYEIARAFLELDALVGEMANHLEAVLKLSPDCKRCAYLLARAKEIRREAPGQQGCVA